MTMPLEGVRVVEYAQYVAGPLCGVLLADLGADVVKVEPPSGDGYRYVMPVAPGLGRYFIPLNRGKRSVVVDLKTPAGLETSARLLGEADIVLHNFPRERASRFGLGWDDLHGAHPSIVVGRVSSFGTSGPLADAPAYDLVAQARAGLLTAHASRGDDVPLRAGGIPMADLTAGFLLATGVLAALVRARDTGEGELVDVSLLAAAMAVQLQDLVWLAGEDDDRDAADRGSRPPRGARGRDRRWRRDEPVLPLLRVVRRLCRRRVSQPRAAARVSLPLRTRRRDGRGARPRPRRCGRARRQGGVDGSHRACVRPAVRFALARAARVRRSAERSRAAAGDDLRRSSGRRRASYRRVAQPGLGDVDLLAPFVRVGGVAATPSVAPELGADTDAVLAELA